MFKHNEAFSFQIATEDQEETDRYWNAIVGNGGQESQCGWCKDKWGISWQITPRVLTDALAAGGDEAKRAFEAMMENGENRRRRDRGGAARLKGWPRAGPTRHSTMTITITAFERSPDGGKGLARDTRVRWALEEVGQPYEVRLVSFRAMKEPAHLALHPFGQIPTYEEGDLALFETGAIVFHIAEHHAGLFPDDANARARAITWMFAALNTVEPPILELVTAKFWRATSPGPRSACRWSRTAFAIGWTNFPPAWAMPTGSMGRSARAT